MKKPEYLKHPVNRRVLRWTQILENRGDMIPCDIEGNPLSEDCVTQAAVAVNKSVKTVAFGNSEYRKQQEKKHRDEFMSANAENARRKSLPYDGVMGVLPEWVPEREHPRFEEKRTLLLCVIIAMSRCLDFLSCGQDISKKD
jgi:hypothetical protein